MEKLLFTGGTGFLGKNIMPLLTQIYEVATCGITSDDNIQVNLAKDIPNFTGHFDVVLHACGKAHVVPKTNEEIKAFFDVNYQGTVNICKGLEKVGVPKSFVFISTCSVYGLEKGEMITEESPLKSDTPYGKSKIMAEQYLQEWCKEHNVILTILRPSLLAGKGAPGNLGEMINGIKKGYYVNIAGGKAKKSILMAEDIGRLIPLVENKGGIYNVCDTDQPTYGALSASIAKQMGKRNPLSIPYSLAFGLAKIGDLFGKKAPINSYRLQKLTESCTFSNEKARVELGWLPLSVIDNFKI